MNPPPAEARAPEAKPLTVTLPFSPYRIEVGVGRRVFVVNLSPNSGDMKGAYWGRNPRFRAMLVAKAKETMRDAAYLLALDALRRSPPRTGGFVS